MPRFSIIIVSWNALPHLKTFLPSVGDTTYYDYEIILADNASTDGSKQWVRKHHPEVKIVTFDQNYGYCGGNNRAVPYASGEILLFLNNDVKVEPDWLSPLAAVFDSRPEAAAVQPKMLSYERPDEFEYAGAAGGYIDRYGYPFCRGRIFDTIEKDRGQYDDERTIFWASGAAFAIRKNIFQELGGFDEDFEFHMEEIDLCWRLWNSGHTVMYCPQSVVYHLGGGSLPTDSPRKLYYNYRNSLRMLWKNYPASSLLFRFPVRLALDKIAALRELLSGNGTSFIAIARAHLHFWLSLGDTAVKRKKLKKNADNMAAMKPFSIVWLYFIKGVKRFQNLK
jgi:GT2 family glycosyltransferase